MRAVNTSIFLARPTLDQLYSGSICRTPTCGGPAPFIWQCCGRNIHLPLAKESDEEKGISKDEKTDKDKEEKEKSHEEKDDKSKEEKDTKSKEVKKNEPFSIDFDGLNHRIVAIPLPAADYSHLQVGNAGPDFLH